MPVDLERFISLTQLVGQQPALVQGGGGNVSLKIDSRQMLIKASGFRLAEIAADRGLAAIDYAKAANYYLSLEEGKVSEQAGDDFIKSCILPTAGPELRPSMETGFHAFLGHCVVHTHSVYANVINCSVDGEVLLKKIFSDFKNPIIWVGYHNPGLQLALGIKKATDGYQGKDSGPIAIFLQNHGLIVSGEDVDEVFSLHEKIQLSLKSYFDFGDSFPKISIKPSLGEQSFIGRTSYLKNFLRENSELIDNFSANILFPDQAVFGSYLGGKIRIEKINGEIVYQTNIKEALAIEEILTSWAFIVNSVQERSLSLRPLPVSDVEYILNMESEKYRQNLFDKEKK